MTRKALFSQSIDSPVGLLLIIADDEGLLKVAYEREGHEAVLETAKESHSVHLVRSGGIAQECARQMEEYFAGRRRQFTLPVHLEVKDGLRKDVVTHLPEIDYGRTITYAQLAAKAGHPRAFQAVGSACASNPVPIIYPCHRVIHSDGHIGNYIGGVQAKQTLLGLEDSVANF